MPGWISVLLITSATLCVLALVFWALTARTVNERNRNAALEELAKLGRSPVGAPVHRCSCGHPKGIHAESGNNGPCLRMVGTRPCGCEGWNP